MKYLSLLLFILMITGCKKHVKKSLPVLMTAPVIIKANIVESGGTIVDNGGSPITQRGICWAEHTEPTLSDSNTTDGTGDGTFVSSFTELKGNTTYYVRAYATNATGTAYGNELSFTTDAGLATVTTAEVSQIRYSATAGGDVTDDGGSPVTERGIVYALTPNPTTDNIRITAGNGTGTFHTPTSLLGSEKEYYLRAYAINSHGTSYGNEVKFNTPLLRDIAVDADGNGYRYLFFCDKLITWQNLKSTRYANGDPIINGSTGYDWLAGIGGAYAFPNGDTRNKETHGLLYNIQAVNDERNVCPAGWHVATDEDWKDFEVCYGDMERIVADKTGWRHSIHYSLVEPLQYSGYLSNLDATFHETGREGLYWTATPAGNSGNWIRKYAPFNGDDYAALWRNPARDTTMSVRCVKAYEGEFD